MMQRKRRRTGTVTRWAGVCVCVAAIQGVAVAASSAEARAGTYRWHGELVSYEWETMTIRSRIVSQAGLVGTEALEADDRILITWSGSRDSAHGVRFVQPLRSDSEAFRLPATLVGVDMASRRVTFQLTIPAGTVATARVLRPGMWATFTSPAQPDDEAKAVTALGKFASTDRTRAAGDSYRWHAEFVSLDSATRTLTVRSRIVSDEGLASLRGITAGEPIAITWSGFGRRAHGVRFVDRDYGRLNDHLQLPAEFVAADPETRYLTFRVARPADRPGAAWGLNPGEWLTLTSSRQPALVADAVSMVRPFVTAGHPQQTPRTARRAPKAGTYRWHGELVSVDRTARTITVKSRMVSRDSFAALDNLPSAEPIVITWSGFEDRAHGIRRVERADRASESAEGFQLSAEFVAFDPDTRYLTFVVETGIGGLTATDGLVPGEWTTVTSPHQLADRAIVRVDAYETSRQARRDAREGEPIALRSTSLPVRQ